MSHSFSHPWDESQPAIRLWNELYQPLGDYVCPLYVMSRGQGRLVGSGVPISANGRRFIATAAHVLDEGQDQPLLTLGARRALELSGERRAFRFIPGQTADVDLGIVILGDEEWCELTQRYSVTYRGDIDDAFSPKTFAVYVLVGYPYTMNKPTPARKYEIDTRVIFPMSNTIAPASHVENGIYPDVHFTLQIFAEQPQSRKIRRIPKMNGMSGGGVWRFDGDGGISERAVPKLVGFGIAYEPAQRMFTCTRAAEALQLLSEH